MVFLATTFLLLPLALLGQRTYAAVDMLEPTAPYRSALAGPPEVVSPIQTDQVEGFPGPVSFYRDLRRGVFQLWSPEVAAGAPTGTLPFNGLLSPFSAGYLVLPAWYAVGLTAALALLFCQTFTYLLLRRLGAAVGPSTLAAVAYTFAGTNLVFVHRVERGVRPAGAAVGHPPGGRPAELATHGGAGAAGGLDVVRGFPRRVRLLHLRHRGVGCVACGQQA